MSVYVSPVGLSGAPVANQLSIMATYKERLCESICVNNSNQPNATVTYTTETAKLNNNTLFVPVIARIQLLSPTKCCKATSQVFTERFIVAFQDRTSFPTAITIESVGTELHLACVRNGKSLNYIINDSLIITLETTAAASN